MNALDIIDEHLAIRETVGYGVLSEVPIEDMPKVLEFLKIVYNYNRMRELDLQKAEDDEYKKYAEAYRKTLRVKQEEEEQQPGWEDPMVAHLDQEEKYRKSLEVLSRKAEEREERKLIKKILSDPNNADGFSDNTHRYPKYSYEGYTYILDNTLTRIAGVEVPTAGLDDDDDESSWMDKYYNDYLKLQASGMFYELHPEWTGEWKRDKYAFCHEQLMKKK